MLIESTGLNQNAHIAFQTTAQRTLVGANIRVFGSTFEVFDANSNTERLIIDNQGKVGLGTTEPTADLDVSGSTLRLRTPNQPNDATPCEQGEIRWSEQAIYLCIRQNTWRKANLSQL